LLRFLLVIFLIDTECIDPDGRTQQVANTGRSSGLPRSSPKD
jgi:hypothetical protein